jgi:hypothetical protein
MSDPAPVAIGTAPSQVSAAQWQSFEMRMRKRRATRLLVRARAALEQGHVDEAEAALEEARTLDSSPEIEALLARLPASAAPVDVSDSAPADIAEAAPVDVAEATPAHVPQTVAAASPEPVLPPYPRFRAWIAVAASLLLVAALAMWDVENPGPQPAPSATPASTTAAERVTPTSVASAEGVRPTSTTGRLDAVPVAETTSAPAPTTEPDAIEPALSYPPATPPGRLASGEPIATAATPVEPLRAEPVTDLPVRDGIAVSVPPAPAPASPIVPASSDVSVPAPSVSAPIAPPPAEPQPVDEMPVVRRVLSQYEAAYSSLDVTAAKRVWPSLDTLALAHAFGGLQMQRISLGDCRVTFNGPAARANCRGSAEWTPKIGGGTRSGNRTWSIDLRKTDGQWRIVDAIAR